MDSFGWKWSCPLRGWVKANANGACNVGMSKAAVGGVIRNEHGNWLFDFARSIGVCWSLLAEVQTVRNVLVHAWRLRFRFVEVEMDSLEDCPMGVRLFESPPDDINHLVLQEKLDDVG
ncbi:hypothetical protein GQ457_09G002420 [Hibiscus cannabinus]